MWARALEGSAEKRYGQAPAWAHREPWGSVGAQEAMGPGTGRGCRPAGRCPTVTLNVKWCPAKLTHPLKKVKLDEGCL